MGYWFITEPLSVRLTTQIHQRILPNQKCPRHLPGPTCLAGARSQEKGSLHSSEVGPDSEPTGISAFRVLRQETLDTDAAIPISPIFTPVQSIWVGEAVKALGELDTHPAERLIWCVGR